VKRLYTEESSGAPLMRAYPGMDEHGAGVGVHGGAVVARRHGSDVASLAGSVVRASFTTRKHGPRGHNCHPA